MLFLYLSLVFSFSFFLKKPNEELYIGGSKTNSGIPAFVSKANADIFKMEDVPRRFGYNIIIAENGKVFDISGNGTKLIFYSRHSGNNQQMELIFNNNGHFILRALGRCVNFTGVPIAIESCSELPAFDIDIVNSDSHVPEKTVRNLGEAVTLERIHSDVEQLLLGLKRHDKRVIDTLSS